MSHFLTDILVQAWVLLNAASPWMLGGFLAAALLKAFVSEAFITRHLGGKGIGPVVKSSALGVPLPLCSCGVIPAADGLRKQGASRGAVAAFMVSTPETGVDSIAVTWALLDPVMAIFRPLAAFFTATAAGLTVNALPEERQTPAKQKNSCCSAVHALPEERQTPAKQENFCCSKSGCQSNTGLGHKNESLGKRLQSGLRHAFYDSAKDIGPWFLLGIVIAAIIAVLVPENSLEGALGGEFLSMLIMLVVGIPLYVCASMSTPIAASLVMKGLSPGAALVFLLASPATNAATITVATRILGKKGTAVYVVSIAVCSLVMGFVVNRIYFGFGLDTSTWVSKGEEVSVTLFSAACTVLLLVLISFPMLLRYGKKFSGKTAS